MQFFCTIGAQNIHPFPLLGGRLQGPGFRLALTAENADLRGRNLADQRKLQHFLDRRYGKHYTWGTSGYLEYRDIFLKHLPQMRRDKRYYHLGLDVMAPVHSYIFAPLDAIVVDTGFEEGKGNYGGWVLLRHDLVSEHFYSFYGHLDTSSVPEKTSQLVRGTPFARIGDFHDNGDWFHHVHLQILTQRGLDEGFLSRGYCREDELEGIAERCPSPMLLFRS